MIGLYATLMGAEQPVLGEPATLCTPRSSPRGLLAGTRDDLAMMFVVAPARRLVAPEAVAHHDRARLDVGEQEPSATWVSPRQR